MLQDPLTNSPLPYPAPDDPFVRDGEGNPTAYPVRRGVPILLPPRPEAQGDFDYVDHYQKDAREFDYFQPYEDPATTHENRRLHEAILTKLPAEARTVLDVGCGGGWLAGAIKDRVESLVSFDISLDNVLGTLQLNPAPSHRGVVGDVLALPFSDASFDAVVSAEVIEHVPDVNGYLHQIVRVLKPGGRAVISTPYKETIQYSLCIHCNNPTPHNAHLRSFDERSLDGMLGQLPVTLQHVIFSNKGLLFGRTHKVLHRLPHAAWRAVDRVANGILRKPSRIIYVIDKH